MKTICTGISYRIFNETMKTYDQLPVQAYVVRYSQNEGFTLQKYSDIEIKESKIYGVHLPKVKKVLDSFELFDRNLGVILSGDKGIGKSLFAKLLAVEAMKKGLPLIIIDEFVPGIAAFLEMIEQEVVVLFDEFDKTFCDGDPVSPVSPQTSMLSLFDGVAGGKKLFVITCNELRGLNEYLINRPGRFHYHFRFEYPTGEEIREYLQDKIPEEQYPEIPNVIAFSKKVKLNYDCLRAVAFELSRGLQFKDAISDLNILNTGSVKYNVTLLFKSGMMATSKNVSLDLFSDDRIGLSLYDKKGRFVTNVEFNTEDCVLDPEKMAMVIRPENLELNYSDNYEESVLAENERLDEAEVLIFSRVEDKKLHYNLYRQSDDIPF